METDIDEEINEDKLPMMPNNPPDKTRIGSAAKALIIQGGLLAKIFDNQ
jgi:hypothetical protein